MYFTAFSISGSTIQSLKPDNPLFFHTTYISIYIVYAVIVGDLECTFYIQFSARATGHWREVLHPSGRNCWQDKETKESVDNAYAGQVRSKSMSFVNDL